MTDHSEVSLSIPQVVLGMVLVIGLFGWGCLATSYQEATAAPLSPEEQKMPSRRAMRRTIVQAAVKFVVTGVQQLPNLPQVMLWHLQNRLWLPLAILGTQVGAVGCGFGLKLLEGVADDPYRKLRESKETMEQNQQSSPKRISAASKKKNGTSSKRKKPPAQR